MPYYPLGGLIESQSVTPFFRAISDEFESGATTTRNPWPAGFAKRRYSIAHCPLTIAEHATIQNFHAARSGGNQSFYYRDNAHRLGNRLVRFAKDPQTRWAGSAALVNVELEEVAPARVHPDSYDFSDAVAYHLPPKSWWSGQREHYHTNHAAAATVSPVAFDLIGASNAVWSSGGPAFLAPETAVLTPYNISASNRAVGTGILSTSGMGTLFAVVKLAATADKTILLSVGANTSTTSAFGLKIESNKFGLWTGTSSNYAATEITNPADGNWHTICGMFGGPTSEMYFDGVLVGSASVVRSYVEGPPALGAAPDGTLYTRSYVTDALIGDAIISYWWYSPVASTMHNLLAPVYGYAPV